MLLWELEAAVLDQRDPLDSPPAQVLRGGGVADLIGVLLIPEPAEVGVDTMAPDHHMIIAVVDSHPEAIRPLTLADLDGLQTGHGYLLGSLPS